MKKLVSVLVVILFLGVCGYTLFNSYQPPAIRTLNKYETVKVIAVDYNLKTATLQLDANTSAQVVYTDDNKPLVGETWSFQVHQFVWDKTTIHFVKKVN